MIKNPSFRILSFFLLVLTVLSLMTGCVRSGVGIVIDPDDSGDVELSLGVSKEYYQSLIDQYGTEFNEGKETFEINDGDTTYVCMSEHKAFQNLEELKQILLDLEYTNVDTESLFSIGEEAACEECDPEESSESEEKETLVIAKDEESLDTGTHIFKSVDVTKDKGFFVTTYHMNLVTDTVPTSTDELSLFGLDTDSFCKVLISVTLPGEVKAEGAVIQDNTASFQLTDLEEENTLAVESKSVDTVRIVAIVVAVILIILLVGLFSKSAKKKSKTKSL